MLLNIVGFTVIGWVSTNSIAEFAGISTSFPLSQIDFTSPPPAPTAVASAVPLPISPPASGDIITPARAPAPAPTAKSLP